jgi:hypothetical protein
MDKLRNEQLVDMIKTIKYGEGLQRTLWKLKMNTASFWKFRSIPGMVTRKWIWGGVRTNGIFDKRLSLMDSCQVVGTLHVYIIWHLSVSHWLGKCDWGKSNEAAVFGCLWSRALLCSQRLVYTSSRQVTSVCVLHQSVRRMVRVVKYTSCGNVIKLNNHIANRANRAWMFVK